jgi:hypothetical protein
MTYSIELSSNTISNPHKMEYPTVPERVSSLLPAAKLKTLEAIQKRRHTSFSSLTAASSIEDFLEAKKNAIDAEIQLSDTQKLYLNEALDNETITADQHANAIKNIDHSEREEFTKTEFALLVRQKKILTEDLKEVHPSYTEFDDAYASLIMEKVEAARANTTHKQNSFNQSAFRDRVLQYYFAEKGEGDNRQDYCVVTGWHVRTYSPKLKKLVTQTKAAHIVPKSLQGQDLNYLFGVGETLLSEARNGMLCPAVDPEDLLINLFQVCLYMQH